MDAQLPRLFTVDLIGFDAHMCKGEAAAVTGGDGAGWAGGSVRGGEGGGNGEAGSKANALLPHHRPPLHFEFYQSVQTVR